MKNSTLGAILTLMVLLIFSPALQAQVSTAKFYTVADLSIGNGTGGDIGDAVNRNFGGGGNLMMCNFDDYPGYMSPFEAWIKFDLTTLEDSIPDGESILYAEMYYKMSNNTGNGFICYHLKNADDWVEGNGGSGSLDTEEGMTWTTAQDYDYENPDNYTHIMTNTAAQNLGGGYIGTVNVTEPVLWEMGDDGNKIMTLRFAPTITDLEEDKKWLGFFGREAPWGVIMENGINEAAPHIIFYIGPPQPTEFSDIEGFGDINDYMITPPGFQKWAVMEDEGDDRLVIMERPAPIEGTPGGLAIYKAETYTDFDISVKAKLNKEKSGELDPKTDFAIVFGHVNNEDYRYMLFTGEDINGFYVVDTTGGLHKTEVGDLNTAPAVADMNWHDYRLVRSGTTVTAYIDGVEYMSVTDEELGVEGSIGMGSYNDIALFDDFIEGEGEPISVDKLSPPEFKVFPNPAADKLFITSDFQINALVITNISGQEIMKMGIQNTGHAELNTSFLEGGLYFITVYGQNGYKTTRKLIIK